MGIFDNSKDAVSSAPIRTIPRALNIALLNESVRFQVDFSLSLMIVQPRSTKNGVLLAYFLYSTRVRYFFKTNNLSKCILLNKSVRLQDDFSLPEQSIIRVFFVFEFKVAKQNSKSSIFFKKNPSKHDPFKRICAIAG